MRDMCAVRSPTPNSASALVQFRHGAGDSESPALRSEEDEMRWTLRDDAYEPQTDEGGDIGEGLSNQPENDPDD